MRTEFRESFAKDLRKISDRSVLKKVERLIKQVEAAESPSDIPHLKKLAGNENFYRIRIGDFRVGVAISSQVLTFVRLLNRKDIYRYFP